MDLLFNFNFISIMATELEKYQQARIEALEKENQRLKAMLNAKGVEV